MKNLIRNNQLSTSQDLPGSKESDFSDEQILIPLELFINSPEQFTGRQNLGIWIDSDQELDGLAEHLDKIQVIALNFPVFNDGRSFSNAAMLRQNLNFNGEIRAIGDVRRDQLEQMVRCGFDAFELSDDQDPDQALAALAVFSFSYQSSSPEQPPLFRQRHPSR